ncbi:hypothetical protein Q4520_07585 [Alteromonas sp. 1_MG-2023]|uniref:sugar phosphate isomerase/epimerase family protein n=1 Tax=Alteromonas sp. 1_MG-2023 TaxID=3062669 RepID=UPI0026E1B3AD|nr:hypothetical protein [Alteromonas sp. 1_MG-2023]MDO6475276.1 hypothetical protein [Alteromonas sp. 1_MG-2023]
MANLKSSNMGVTLFSFTNEYVSRKLSFEEIVRKVAEMNLGPGLEVIGFQSIREFPDVSDNFVCYFKSLTQELNLTPTSLAINSDRYLKRGQAIPNDALMTYHKRQIESASKLGFPIVRFQYSMPIEMLPELADYSEKMNVKMGLEVHAPLFANHPIVLKFLEAYDKINSDALGLIPDFGGTATRIPASLLESARIKGVPEPLIVMAVDHWHETGSPPEKVQKLRDYAIREGFKEEHIQTISMPFFMITNNNPLSWRYVVDKTIHIHGKFYRITDEGDDEAIDYQKIIPLFRDAGYSGTFSSEYEGHGYCNIDAFDQVKKHQIMCSNLFSQTR